MKEQNSIPKHKVTRAASLIATGAKVGYNYAKYVGKKTITGNDDKREFHEATASDTYKVFSKLKGGPLKIAQMLSLDQNLLPQAYVREFSKAQYTAPPLSYPLVVRTFKREFSQGPSEMFDTFTKKAMAGASIGQVHKATKGGKDYAVKVQYPGVADSLDSDLRIVKPLAMRLFQLDAATIDPYIGEIKERVLEETDYKLELRRSEELAEATRHLPNVNFPSYYKKFSGNRVITMDWVEGLHLDQFAQSDASQEVRDKIGQALWDFYHFQIHELGIFHADPHAGNFIVRNDQLWVLDFGCVKKLDSRFYDDYFALMDARKTSSDADLDKILLDLKLLKPDDGEAELNKLRPIFRESVDLLSRPFQQAGEFFDFGDEAYLKEIYQFGEKYKDDKELKRIQGGRGNAESLYINRAYFGLYNLQGMLRAKVKTSLPKCLTGQAA